MQVLTLKATNTQEVVRAFTTRRNKLIQSVRPVFETAGRRAELWLKEYPPDRGYRRTGTLGRRWQKRTTFSSSEIRVNLYNMTEYGPYVQSKTSQARVHRGFWQTDEDVLKRVEGPLIEELSGALYRGLA